MPDSSAGTDAFLGGETRSAQSPHQFVRLPMLPVRSVAVGGVAAAFVLSAWQAARVINGNDRLAGLGWGALLMATIGAVAVVLWTWIIAENARRLLSPARTQELPDPGHAAMTWIVPLTFIAGASAVVTYLSARLNTPSEGTESSLPLLLALAAIILALPMMYSPVTYLSGVVRKVGGHGIRFAEWIWVPVALTVVGVGMIAGLRIGGVFGEDFDGVAPAWVIGVAAIVPAVVVIWLGWRAAATVEADIGRAFDRRLGTASKLSRHSSTFSRMYADGGPNHTALRQKDTITQLPGAHVLGVAVAAGLAGVALLSLVGSVVMALFWQESSDGVLLASQSKRAWDVVALLHTIERNVAIGLIAAVSIWSLLAVTNVRLASARRRNPVLAAAAWPVAAGGVWVVGSRLVADGSAPAVIGGFFGQALVLAAPFFLLYRAAGSIGSRRQSLRIAWALGVVLLVHVQGLGGLSTLDTTTEAEQIARLAGYLAVGALLQLLAMFAVASAMQALTDTTQQVAARHNSLVEQRQQMIVVGRGPSAPPPRMNYPEISGVPQA